MSRAIDIEAVSRSFDLRGRRVLALDRIDLSIAAGEFVTLVGASGCGKSTVLRLVAGLEEPDTGRIMVGRVEIDGPGVDRAMYRGERPFGLRRIDLGDLAARARLDQGEMRSAQLVAGEADLVDPVARLLEVHRDAATDVGYLAQGANQ